MTWQSISAVTESTFAMPFLCIIQMIVFLGEKIIHLLPNNIHCHCKLKAVFLHKNGDILNGKINILTPIINILE